MSSPGDSAKDRPRQVTTAAWLIMGGSGLLIAAAFETISGLNSLETRDSIQSALDQAPLSGTGIDLQSVRSALRVAALILGGCAAATAILGYQVLRRDRTARTALTLLALPLVLTGFTTDPFLAPMVGAAIGMLWVQPARDWFSAAPRAGSSA